MDSRRLSYTRVVPVEIVVIWRSDTETRRNNNNDLKKKKTPYRGHCEKPFAFRVVVDVVVVGRVYGKKKKTGAMTLGGGFHDLTLRASARR